MKMDSLSSAADFDFLVDNAPFAIIEWDATLRVQRWAGGAVRLFGWRDDDVLGLRAEDWTFLHPDDAPLLQRAFEKLLAGSTTQSRVLCRTYARNKNIVDTEWHVVAKRDGSGEVQSLLTYINDLTLQHRAEKALVASEVRYRSIFANSHAVMLILDPDSGRIVDVNPAGVAFYGWPRESMIQMHISALNTLSPAELQAEMQAAREARRTHFEFRHRRADGSVRDVEVYSGPTEDGDRTLLFSIVHDITERKRAEMLSRRWERFFRLSNLGIAMHDVAENVVIDVNASYAAQHGYEIAEMRGMNVADLYAPEERTQLPARLAEADRVGNTSFETVHLRKDGTRLPMVIGITALQDDHGTPVARFVFALDISARKAAEENLRKLSRAVEESPESIVITNTLAEIEYVNQAFIDTTGYSLEEAIGKNPRVLQSGHTTPEIYRDLWSTVTQGKSWRGEFYNRRKDGSEYLENVTITPIHDENGETTHYVAVKQDITEKRRMEEELLRYRDHLEGLVASRTTELQHALDAANVANRAKSEFLTTMSHEIRTPMNGVIGLLDVLSHSSLSDEQTHLVEIMHESASTLLRLIDDILDFSKIESGNLELDVGPVSIRSLIDGVADILHPVADQKGVKLTTHVADDIPDVVSTDGLRLQQVLFNLASNAVKFSAGLARVGRVDIRVEAAGTGLIRFSVTDNGIGMSPEVFGKIFKPFSQAESSTTRRFGGTGLGLSISSRLVRLLKGRIEVRSLPGRGSRFVVTLPLCAVDGPAAKLEFLRASRMPRAQTAAQPLQLSDSLSRGRILLAEDNDINRRVMERQLALLGLQCDMAENGREALERWRTGHYALLLTDLHMPEMDGYELSERIRSAEPPGQRIPIIAVTANALRGEDRRCFDAGMDAFITKPVQVEVLRRALAQWMPADSPAVAPIPAAPPTPAPAATDFSLFDPQVLPGLIGDEPTLIAEFLADYRVSAQDTAESLRQAHTSGHWHQVGELAHRLKSSSRSVGAMQLGELCATLEQAGRNADIEHIHRLMHDFDIALNAALHAMDTPPTPPHQASPTR